MVIGRRSLLLAGVALPAVARAQCVTDTPSVDACLGGVRLVVPPGLSLDLSFMTPGSLPAGITFTRASTATYFDAAGVMQTATANTPRWDYDPVTHVLNGMLIEEARTNVVLNSGDASNASWPKGNIIVAAPVVTGNQIASPAGTITAARVVYPLVSGAGAASNLGLTAGTVATAAAYTLSIWARGAVGGERVYLSLTPDGTLFYRVQMNLTTSWQRFTLTTPNLTAVTWYPAIGCDLRDASQTSTPAQTIYVWGAQIELGAFPTSYTTATRAAEVCSMPLGAWFNAAAGTLEPDAMIPVFSTARPILEIDNGTINNRLAPSILPAAVYGLVSTSGAQVNSQTANSATAGVPFKAAMAYDAAGSRIVLNAGAVAAAGVPAGGMPTGLTTLWFAQVPGGTPTLCGYLRRVRYWPRALTNAELQAVTT